MISEVYNEDCNIGLSKIPDHSIEIILTDPPYKYLKNQKLEVDFDETIFFDHVKRVLKKDGFIVMFGRGTSFYRWNTMLADRGFQFKEEVIWNKVYTSSPVTPISRVHECATIHSIDGSINTSFVGYCEMRTDLKQVIYDVNRIKSALNNTKELNELISFLKTGELEFKGGRRVLGNSTTVQSAMRDSGKAVKTLQSIQKGMKEKSVIELNRDHYTSIHPTQKPVRLLERLLALVIKSTTDGSGTVLDPFMGSGSTALAAYNMGLDFIGYEIDKEYFEGAEKRIKEHTRQLKLFV